MIDIHHHCLPDVDDGPREWDEAVAMCSAAAEEGIETIVATPHVLRGRWKAFGIPELEARIAELRRRVGETPRLLLGSEYFFAHDVVEVLGARNAIVPLAGSRYVLVELAANSVPPLIEQPLYRMQLEGWVPVLAHPERNLVFQARPDALAELLDHGVKTQVTAGSLTGEFGEQARRAAETFLRRNLVHTIATDAHNMTKRPPRIRQARAVLEELAGEQVADALMVRNPRAIVENRALEYDPGPSGEAESGFFTRLRSFFGR
ncbi:MAG TPA: CpsB/CapC family capsule biosynthesis tyrosine phosphatase [Thermoanaerobaculia bacterium]|nr:CpsB/CapC family capsule biosynthesis tyrosine phosphatase [Thermoanaerobaculia bacterium]